MVQGVHEILRLFGSCFLCQGDIKSERWVPTGPGLWLSGWDAEDRTPPCQRLLQGPLPPRSGPLTLFQIS